MTGIPEKVSNEDSIESFQNSMAEGNVGIISMDSMHPIACLSRKEKRII